MDKLYEEACRINEYIDLEKSRFPSASYTLIMRGIIAREGLKERVLKEEKRQGVTVRGSLGGSLDRLSTLDLARRLMVGYANRSPD